jgi:hypothetical protein
MSLRRRSSCAVTLRGPAGGIDRPRAIAPHGARISRPLSRESRSCGGLHRCFDNWRGIGDIVAGMAREDYDLELRRYNGRGRRAIFFQSGFEHSLMSHAGAAWARSPWEAVQRAAADALRKAESPDAPPHDWTTTDESPQ